MPASDRPPPASTPGVAARMRAQRRRDTAPELAVRRLVHARGLRYRVDHPLPGLSRRRGDLVFTRAKVVVFVDGCFWHGCPVHSRPPRSNRGWWESKLAANRARDADTDARLSASGWSVVRVWEHDDPQAVAATIEGLVTAGV